jgi:hypothetical protein
MAAFCTSSALVVSKVLFHHADRLIAQVVRGQMFAHIQTEQGAAEHADEDDQCNYQMIQAHASRCYGCKRFSVVGAVVLRCGVYYGGQQLFFSPWTGPCKNFGENTWRCWITT